MKRLNEYVKTAKAATILGVSQNTLRAWAKEGKIAVHRNAANGYRLFSVEVLHAFLKEIATPQNRCKSLTNGEMAASGTSVATRHRSNTHLTNGHADVSLRNGRIGHITNLERVPSASTPTAYSKKLPAAKPVYVVDFFCGCGGMSWGFANTRQSHLAYQLLGGFDIDERALATYSKNTKAPGFRHDIRTLADNPHSLEQIVGRGPLSDLRPLVFVGCPPCQGFSAHRKKDERDDPRNDLAVAFATLCAYYRPDIVAMENVPEMLKGRFETYFQEAENILKRSGYSLTKDILDLSRYGVPQRRMRAVVLGSLGSPIEMPEPTLPSGSFISVRDAIGHLSPIIAGHADDTDPYHRAPAHVSRIIEMIKRIPPDGGDRRSLPAKSRLRCHNDVDQSDTPGFTDVYGRLRWDSPAVTITAKSSTPSCGRFLHPEQHRNISVREAAILQGFPQEFTFEGPFVNQYRQIGEAVPPLFARSLAWSLLDYLRPTPKNSRPNFSQAAMRRRLSETPTLGVIDAFCGAGGLSIGFEAAGFSPLFAFDTDPSAVSTFNHNLHPGAVIADVCDRRTAFRVSESVPTSLPYVIVGGPPCQGFSQQRRGSDTDDRNNLVIHYARLVTSLKRKPAAVVLENVTYLDSPRGQRILVEYSKMMEQLGFVLFRHDLNSADYGVPQLRHRIVLVAILPRFASRYSGPKQLSTNRWVTVGEVLKDLPIADNSVEGLLPNHEPSKEGSVNRRRIMFVDMGRGRMAIPDELQLDCHKKYGGHLDVYGRLDWFSFARTITGGFDSYTRGEFAHPYFHRSITPREAARIQGFPDWFSFLGNRAAVRRQIGNAVPPPLGFAIGKSLSTAILEGA